MSGNRPFAAERATSSSRCAPQGPTNAPAVFLYFMNDTLGEYLDGIAVGILDDVIIFFEDPPKHVEHVRSILQV